MLARVTAYRTYGRVGNLATKKQKKQIEKHINGTERSRFYASANELTRYIIHTSTLQKSKPIIIKKQFFNFEASIMELTE